MKSKNKNINLLYNSIGIILLLIGTSLFYTGIKGLLLIYVSSNPINQFYIGSFMLGIAYIIFNKKINLLS